MLLKMLELADTEDYIATLQEDNVLGHRKTTKDQSMVLLKFVQFNLLAVRSYEKIKIIKSKNMNRWQILQGNNVLNFRSSKNKDESSKMR